MAPGDVSPSLIGSSRPPFSFASYRTLSISSSVESGAGTGMGSFTRIEDGAWRRVWFTNWSAQSGEGVPASSDPGSLVETMLFGRV